MNTKFFVSVFLFVSVLSLSFVLADQQQATGSGSGSGSVQVPQVKDIHGLTFREGQENTFRICDRNYRVKVLKVYPFGYYDGVTKDWSSRVKLMINGEEQEVDFAGSSMHIFHQGKPEEVVVVEDTIDFVNKEVRLAFSCKKEDVEEAFVRTIQFRDGKKNPWNLEGRRVGNFDEIELTGDPYIDATYTLKLCGKSYQVRRKYSVGAASSDAPLDWRKRLDIIFDLNGKDVSFQYLQTKEGSILFSGNMRLVSTSKTQNLEGIEISVPYFDVEPGYKSKPSGSFTFRKDCSTVKKKSAALRSTRFMRFLGLA